MNLRTEVPMVAARNSQRPERILGSARAVNRQPHLQLHVLEALHDGMYLSPFQIAIQIYTNHPTSPQDKATAAEVDFAIARLRHDHMVRRTWTLSRFSEYCLTDKGLAHLTKMRRLGHVGWPRLFPVG